MVTSRVATDLAYEAETLGETHRVRLTLSQLAGGRATRIWDIRFLGRIGMQSIDRSVAVWRIAAEMQVGGHEEDSFLANALRPALLAWAGDPFEAEQLERDARALFTNLLDVAYDLP